MSTVGTVGTVTYRHLHHAAFTLPPGQEDRARAFYTGVLGLTEIPKPATMRPIGCWFRHDGIEIHGVPDADFVPNRLGHPAIVVDDLDALAERLAAHGIVVQPDDRFPGHRRFHTYDCFGNQLEFLQPVDREVPA
ncbi:VOC family protein [Nakamurella endophytica]|uniref:Glyoxalase n=1 Tax=Nakamurella endophytica TaxID=1748367 RepID=A0A917SVR9_9ACTN|nr:VOC family protein [Nakamurella endophytica]GGL97837.1 glyoxalase [Nakamurella endophytica]